MSAPVTRPEPPASDLSAPYWAAAAEGRLVLQTCSACGAVRHYPRLLCDQCYSGEFDWTQASGEGRVHSWTVAHHPFHPAFAEELPYTLVTVDLIEGPRALGRWQSATPPSIGLSTVGRFRTCPDGTPELVFTSFD